MAEKEAEQGQVTEVKDERKTFADLANEEAKLNIKCMHCKRCGSKIVKDLVASLIEDRKVLHGLNFYIEIVHFNLVMKENLKIIFPE